MSVGQAVAIVGGGILTLALYLIFGLGSGVSVLVGMMWGGLVIPRLVDHELDRRR